MIFGIFQPQIPGVTADEVYDAIEKNEKIHIIDVRTPEEFAKCRINKSVNVPVNKVVRIIQNVIPNKKAIIYVYCLSGSRSVVAVDTMIKLGYTQVYNMQSGLLAWRAKKYPHISS